MKAEILTISGWTKNKTIISDAIFSFLSAEIFPLNKSTIDQIKEDKTKIMIGNRA